MNQEDEDFSKAVLDFLKQAREDKIKLEDEYVQNPEGVSRLIELISADTPAIDKWQAYCDEMQRLMFGSREFDDLTELEVDELDNTVLEMAKRVPRIKEIWETAGVEDDTLRGQIFGRDLN